MERVNYGNVAPEIAALFASMQRQIDDCNARAAAAETRAAAAERLVQEKDAEIARLKNTIHTYQRMLFGSRSEKTRYLNDFQQLSMFSPEDELSDEGSLDEGTIPITGHTRKAKKQWSSFIDEMIEFGRYPVEDEIIDLPEPERIDKDGKPLEYIGTELVRRMLKTTRQEYRVQRVFRKVYGSPRDKETLKRETVVGGEVPPGVIPHSPASSSVIADIVTKKYLYSEPLYRQERHCMTWALCSTAIPWRVG